MLVVLAVVGLLEVNEEPGDEDGGYPRSQVQMVSAGHCPSIFKAYLII